MAVYFIIAEPSGHVKVGFSKDVAVRLQRLQAPHYETLSLIGEIPGDRTLEREIHGRLATHRVRNTEWFRGSAELMETIRQILANPPVSEVAATQKPISGGKGIRANIRELRLCARLSVAELAKQSNLSPDALRKIEAGTRDPSIRSIVRIGLALRSAGHPFDPISEEFFGVTAALSATA